jgi:hypothetical protein
VCLLASWLFELTDDERARSGRQESFVRDGNEMIGPASNIVAPIATEHLGPLGIIFANTRAS